MRRLFTLALSVVFCLSSILLVSCTSENHTDEKLKIVTTIFPQYDFARRIIDGCENSVSITMLLPPGSESHDFEASLADLSLIEQADLIIAVGGETDEWIEKAVSVAQTDAVLLNLTDIVPLYPESTDGIFESDHHHEKHVHDHDSHDHDYDHSAYDEHVWTSPENAALICKAIGDVLCSLSPENADIFASNAETYVKELRELDRRFTETVENARRDTVIFADRFPFRYLTEHLSLRYMAAFSGCSSDSEPALATIYGISEAVKSSGTPVIFTAEFSNGDAARVISEETGASVRTLHSCHNVSKDDFERGVTYLDIMEENLKVLTEALN